MPIRNSTMIDCGQQPLALGAARVAAVPARGRPKEEIARIVLEVKFGGVKPKEVTA